MTLPIAVVRVTYDEQGSVAEVAALVNNEPVAQLPATDVDAQSVSTALTHWSVGLDGPFVKVVQR